LKKSIGSSGIVVDNTNNGGEKPMLFLMTSKSNFKVKDFKEHI